MLTYTIWQVVNRLLQNFLKNGLLLPERYYSLLRMKEISNGNRNKFEIMAEILRKLHKPTGKTNLMSHCNMSSAQSGQYLNLMMSSNLVRTDAVTGKVTYQRTEAGLEFLVQYNELLLLLDSSISAPFLT